jgi:hypothetical protein
VSAAIDALWRTGRQAEALDLARRALDRQPDCEPLARTYRDLTQPAF